MKCVRTVVLEEADQLMKSDFQNQTLSLLSHLSSPSLQVFQKYLSLQSLFHLIINRK